jgi:hypothetical protein
MWNDFLTGRSVGILIIRLSWGWDRTFSGVDIRRRLDGNVGEILLRHGLSLPVNPRTVSWLDQFEKKLF